MSTWDKPQIQPQPGPQSKAVACRADMVIYGGAAGGGKTAALLIKPLYWIGDKQFRGVLFRRRSVDFTIASGLLDEANQIYPKLGGVYSRNRWTFPSGATIDFAHCEDEADIALKYQGLQAAWIGIDEATSATKKQIMFLRSRLRSTAGSTAGMAKQLMMTCNPESGHCIGEWLKAGGYLDEKGYPIPEMSGVVKYFVVTHNDQTGEDDLLFGDRREDFGERGWLAETFTFIPSKLSDNKLMLQVDPDYARRMENSSRFMVEKYKNGCWNAIEDGEKTFQRPWFKVIFGNQLPDFFQLVVRAWDLALTVDGDYTVGVLMGMRDGNLYILDVVRMKRTPGERNLEMMRIMREDRLRFPNIQMAIEQFSGPGGMEAAAYVAQLFAIFSPRIVPVSQTKQNRISPFAKQLEEGNVSLLYGAWNEDYMAELCAFPNKLINDDQVDATSLAEEFLRCENPSSMSAEFARASGGKVSPPGTRHKFAPMILFNPYEDVEDAQGRFSNYR